MGTFNLFCLQPFKKLKTSCRELFSPGATGANRKQLNSAEPHTMSVVLIPVNADIKIAGFEWYHNDNRHVIVLR